MSRRGENLCLISPTGGLKSSPRMTQKSRKCGDQKAPGGGSICAYSPLPTGKKALKNDTKSPCIYTRKCHKEGVWVIENFLTYFFIFAILWRFCLS